jgi:hypothetical protein
MDLERLRVEEVDAAFEEIKDTEAVIFDIRGYPHGTAWAIAPRLAKERVVTAQFQRMELGADAPGVPSILRFDQYTEPEEDKWRYTGQVVVLIDEHAISQSEHTCLFLESVTDNITFIGTATNGANGDVTVLVLPGNVHVRFTGHDVRHADGRQLTGSRIPGFLARHEPDITPGAFEGEIVRRDNIDLSTAEIVARWDEEHPEDPVELPPGMDLAA